MPPERSFVRFFESLLCGFDLSLLAFIGVVVFSCTRLGTEEAHIGDLTFVWRNLQGLADDVLEHIYWIPNRKILDLV